MGILCVTHLGPLWGLRELLQKKGAVQTMLSPSQPPCDPEQPYGEEPGGSGPSFQRTLACRKHGPVTLPPAQGSRWAHRMTQKRVLW